MSSSEPYHIPTNERPVDPKKTIQAFGIHDVATRLTCGGCRKHISSPDGKCYRCVPKSLRDK
jgi:uncharacterized protein (DUF2126 family)